MGAVRRAGYRENSRLQVGQRIVRYGACNALSIGFSEEWSKMNLPGNAPGPGGHYLMNTTTATRQGFGPTLRRFRLAAEMAGVELANHLEISPAYLHDIEHGRRAPLPLERVVKAAEFLGCPPEAQRELLEEAARAQAIQFRVTESVASEKALQVGVALLLAWSSLNATQLDRIAQAIQDPNSSGRAAQEEVR